MGKEDPETNPVGAPNQILPDKLIKHNIQIHLGESEIIYITITNTCLG